MLVGARAEVCPCVGLRKGYSTKLPLIRRWRCDARVVEEPGLQRPDSQLSGYNLPIDKRSVVVVALAEAPHHRCPP